MGKKHSLAKRRVSNSAVRIGSNISTQLRKTKINWINLHSFAVPFSHAVEFTQDKTSQNTNCTCFHAKHSLLLFNLLRIWWETASKSCGQLPRAWSVAASSLRDQHAGPFAGQFASLDLWHLESLGPKNGGFFNWNVTFKHRIFMEVSGRSYIVGLAIRFGVDFLCYHR